MLPRRGERRARPPLQPIYDDFKPPVEWVQEPSSYILRLYLPQAFKKEELNISYDQTGKITVRGTKQVGELRYARFQSSYNVPHDSNFEKISGKLESNILSLTIPRIIKHKPSEDKKEEPVMEEKAKMVTESRKEKDEATVGKKKPFMAVEEKREDAVIKEKKEEAVVEEKAKLVTEARKEEDEATIAKKEPLMVVEERKEDEVIIEKKEEMVMEKKAKMVTDARMEEDEATIAKKKPLMVVEEKKEEPVMEKKPKMVTDARKEENEATIAKKKPLMVVEERKEDPVIKEKKEEPVMEKKEKMVIDARKEENEATIAKKKPLMDVEERKEDADIKEKKEDQIMNETMQRINEKMKDEAKMTTTAMEERITEAEHLTELKEEQQTVKERNTKERKDEAILKEMKKATIVKEKSRNCHEAEVGEKKPAQKERRKRRWVWNEEEDKGWLDWIDRGFIEEVLHKVYKNKKYITLALVAFTTGYFISRKLRRRG